MLYKFTQIKKGATLAEVLVVIALVALVAGLAWTALIGFNNAQVLEKEVSNALSVLRDARLMTISSKNDSQYGVRVEQNRITLFSGSSFSSQPSNRVTDLDSRVRISSINIAGGSDIVFDRLTGKTANHGILVFSHVASTTQTKSITINESGIAEQQ